MQTPDGHPILSRQHEYVTIWGYWNGPDDVLAVKDEVVYKGIDALAAYREGRLTQRGYVRVMRAAKKRLAAAGIEDLSLRGNHLLLSIDREQKLAVDKKGLPLMRICNFEMLKNDEELASTSPFREAGDAPCPSIPSKPPDSACAHHHANLDSHKAVPP